MEHQPPSTQSKLHNHSTDPASLPQRIWKFKLHYLIVIPALMLIFIFKLLPFANGIMMSFVDYKVFVGLFESTWVGFNHFAQLFDDEIFRRTIVNTFVIKAGYILVSGCIAFLLALALSSIRYKLLRELFSSLFLVPFFIPSFVFAFIFVYILSESTSPFITSGTLILADASYIRPTIVFIEVLKTCGIPIVIALAAIASKHASVKRQNSELKSSISYSAMNVIPALKAVAAFMVLQLSAIMSTDYELIRSLLNPLVSVTGETLDSYIFKLGFLMMNVSPSAAAGVFQFVVQLLFTIIAYFIVKKLFLKQLFSEHTDAVIKTANKGRSLIGIVTACLYSIAVLFSLYMLFIYPFTGAREAGQSVWNFISFWNVFSYTVINFVAVIIFLLMTVTLAYPLTVKHLPGRSLYKLFLLIVISMGSGMINEYIFIRNLELVNTIFPQMFLGFFNLAAVFVLKSIFNGRHADLKAQAEASEKGELHTFFTLFIPKIWKPLLALGVLQFVALWNSYLPSFIYTSQLEKQSPIMKLVQLASSGEMDSTLMLQLGALLSLPSVILFLVFRKWLTSEVFIGQIRKL
ncbi:hypothetical protein [Bacillus sp. FJAT-28004]|uniref:hypothetical protein n=1 Tax=Bacillus sp. FJAT-28004 TaxID=1679165 RepID=UPI0006B68A49|nr:hypothetical protein [Bacillus sp. FJAT-28004]